MSVEEANVHDGPEAPPKPRWLTSITDELEPGAIEAAYDVDHDMDLISLGIIRDMLLAPDDQEETAAADAVQRVRDVYHAHYPLDHTFWNGLAERASYYILADLATTAFHLVRDMSFMDVRHQRLADFLIGFKDAASQELNPANPHLLYDYRSYSRAIYDSLHSHPIGAEYIRGIRENCETWISVAALIGKLLGAGVLENTAFRWVAMDIEEGLEQRGNDSLIHPLVFRCQWLVAAQYILFAGDQLAREAQAPSSNDIKQRLNLDKWKFWAGRLGEISRGTHEEDTEWGLKDAAGKAREKMISLHPELFQGTS